MNPKTVLILFSLCFLALALIPLCAAQETGNMLTDGISWITDGASNLWNQASSFATENPLPTGAAVTGAVGTGIGAYGWKVASKGKKAAESLVNSLSQKLSGAESSVASATEQLTAYKTQAETQLSSLQTEAQKQVTAAQTQAKTATEQLSGLQTKLTEVTQQKASYQNQVEELTARLKTAQDQLAVLTPKIK